MSSTPSKDHRDQFSSKSEYFSFLPPNSTHPPKLTKFKIVVPIVTQNKLIGLFSPYLGLSNSQTEGKDHYDVTYCKIIRILNLTLTTNDQLDQFSSISEHFSFLPPKCTHPPKMIKSDYF